MINELVLGISIGVFQSVIIYGYLSISLIYRQIRSPTNINAQLLISKKTIISALIFSIVFAGFCIILFRFTNPILCPGIPTQINAVYECLLILMIVLFRFISSFIIFRSIGVGIIFSIIYGVILPILLM